MNTDRKEEEQYPHKLNVLFHGLWAYELITEGGQDIIVVRTPPEEEHRVAAGAWNPDADLRPGATYKFEGIKTGTYSVFEETANAIFENKPFKHNVEVQCTIRLPLPDNIRSERPIVFHKDKPPYTGADAHEIESRKIAIVQVFTYSANLPDVRLVTETPATTTDRQRQVSESVKDSVPAPAGDGKVANFYLFAQPNGRVHGSHFETAFAKLAALFGLDIVPVPSIAPGPRTPEPQIPGVIWRDLVGLNERAASLGELVPAAGSSGASCDPFVVDNRKATPGNKGTKKPPALRQTYQESEKDPSQHNMT